MISSTQPIGGFQPSLSPQFRYSIQRSPFLQPTLQSGLRPVWAQPEGALSGDVSLGRTRPKSSVEGVDILSPDVFREVKQRLLHDMSIGVSFNKAITLAGLGFGLALGAGGLLNVLTRRGLKLGSVVQKSVQHTAGNVTGDVQKLTGYYNFLDPLSALYRLALHYENPKERLLLLGFGVSTGIGYLVSNVFSVMEEAWVRLEETRIRAQLLTRLTETYQQSIAQKQKFDEALRQEAVQGIQTMLTRNGLEGIFQKPLSSVLTKPPVEPLEQLRHLFYEPVHRQVAPMRFSAQPGKVNSATSLSPWEQLLHPTGLPDSSVQIFAPRNRLLETVFTAFGALAGLTTYGFLQTVSKSSRLKMATVELTDNVAMDNLKAVMLKQFLDKNWKTMLGFVLVTGLVRIAKLLVDGMRGIELTRMNAESEYRYQRYNWLALDPSFHRIAEEEALRHELSRLEAELPSLKATPDLLQKRIETILTNIGRNSAPPYFSMTPHVGLVEARG